MWLHVTNMQYFGAYGEQSEEVETDQNWFLYAPVQ